jgi:hypothetical protein
LPLPFTPLQAFPCPVGAWRLAYLRGQSGSPLKDLQLVWLPVSAAAAAAAAGQLRGSASAAAALPHQGVASVHSAGEGEEAEGLRRRLRHERPGGGELQHPGMLRA